ncbi:MAG TPA: AraC family transcriptional regulator [Verrucomicrobiae bacterium]
MQRKPGADPGFFSAQVSAARRFYLNLQPPRGTPLAVICGGVEHCAPDYQIVRDTFPFYSIEYVARGEGELRLGGREHRLRPGVVFAYGPGVRQEIRCRPQKPMVKYFVDFAGTQSAQWSRLAGLAPGRVSQVFPPNEIEPLFEELIRNGQRGTRLGPELCRQLLECLGVKLREARAPMPEADSIAFATYQNCRRHLVDHCQRLRSLGQAAAECHVDTAYLCRLFRRYDHQSPYQFLTRQKMNEAASRLQAAGALVKNVAADLGYANPFHFSRVFKAHLGISPDEFRRLR